MPETRREKYAVIGGALALLGLLLGLFHPSFGTFAFGSAPKTQAKTVACSAPATVNALLTQAGFTKGQYSVGENFNLSLPAAVSAGEGSFATKPLTTKVALTSFLASNGASAKTVLSQVEKNGNASRQQVLNQSNWTGFQLLVPSDWSGNTSFVSGRMTAAGTRHSAAGDIGWVFVNPSDCAAGKTVGHGLHYGIVRMGCGNPQTTVPTPHKTTPPSTVTHRPTTPCNCTHRPQPSPSPCKCTTTQQVQIPVQEPGQPTKAAPNAPASPPPTLEPGPGGNQPPPTTSAPNGYDPSGGTAPGGGESNGGSTTVNSPKPDPTPSQAVPTSDPTATGTPPPPG